MCQTCKLMRLDGRSFGLMKVEGNLFDLCKDTATTMTFLWKGLTIASCSFHFQTIQHVFPGVY